MKNWTNEAEAREKIKGLVAEYYHDFKEPEQKKNLNQEIDYLMQVVCMMKKKCVH